MGPPALFGLCPRPQLRILQIPFAHGRSPFRLTLANYPRMPPEFHLSPDQSPDSITRRDAASTIIDQIQSDSEHFNDSFASLAITMLCPHVYVVFTLLSFSSSYPRRHCAVRWQQDRESHKPARPQETTRLLIRVVAELCGPRDSLAHYLNGSHTNFALNGPREEETRRGWRTRQAGSRSGLGHARGRDATRTA